MKKFEAALSGPSAPSLVEEGSSASLDSVDANPEETPLHRVHKALKNTLPGKGRDLQVVVIFTMIIISVIITSLLMVISTVLTASLQIKNKENLLYVALTKDLAFSEANAVALHLIDRKYTCRILAF